MGANQGGQRFNLDTMSGVFPGTRTMVFQRVRLAVRGDSTAQVRWGRLFWYDEPPSCVVDWEASSREEAAPAAAVAASSSSAAHVIAHIPVPVRAEFVPLLTTVLAAAGLEPYTCAACRFWHDADGANPDGLPVGHCVWRPEAGTTLPVLPDALALQSCLGLACSRWQTIDSSRPVAASIGDPAGLVAPMPKAAEQDTDERWTLWGQLRRRLGWRPDAATSGQSLTGWEEKISERSGVGAGTEPCFVCQGRIANLGALAVATPEGDKQTFSIWRCRNCYTYYLNDWIDRWERMDSLETEESYYRLAPAEALAVLAVMEGVVDAEHPGRRHERGAQRAWVLAFLGALPRLSHQIRQGR